MSNKTQFVFSTSSLNFSNNFKNLFGLLMVGEKYGREIEKERMASQNMGQGSNIKY